MELAEKLKHHRKKQGLSQEKVAELLNLSRQAISKWENGHTAPDIDNLVLLSNIYKVSIDELLQENQQLQEAIQENNTDLATMVKEEKKLSHYDKKIADRSGGKWLFSPTISHHFYGYLSYGLSLNSFCPMAK